MSWILYAFIFVLLVIAELLYFRIADRYNIIDKPNSRSSHTGIVIRGGGIIFFIAILLWYVLFGVAYTYFVAGAAAAAFISFMDDLRPQKTLIRFVVHLMAIMLLFYSTGIFQWQLWLVFLAAIVCIGSINAFNFMDGINGITGVYALINLVTFLYIQKYVNLFTETMLISVVLLAVLIFLFFNFRTKAKCFAGDVGSITLSYIQIFLLIQLIIHTGNFFWVIMFLVFGIDSVVTILYRLKRKENIFQAHRTHLYQYLSNELKIPHRIVSSMYGLLQLALNLILVTFLPSGIFIWPLLAAVLFLSAYLIVRNKVQSSLGAA